MLKTVNAQDAVALGRLLEFLSPNPAWNRSLWSIGLILGLSELHEACIACRNGTLSEGSVRRICSTLGRRSGKDPALSDPEKAFLRAQLKDVPKADGPAHHSIANLAGLLEKDYMKRWAGVVSGPGFTVEHFARSTASHLLDAGFSAAHLHDRIKARLQADAPQVTLSEICEDLHGQVSSNTRRAFEVLLAFSKPPKVAGGTPRNWLSGKGVADWLVANGFDTKDVRAPVGILLTVHARDAAGAASAARAESDRFAARAIVATGTPLFRLPFFWVKGDKKPIPLNSNSRGVRVEALYREGVIFSASPSTEVDAAIELLSHLETSSPTAAVAGGWGAIEGLLADPGDRATAADNLAALVACSFVRAELTTLSYKAQEEHAAIAVQLNQCGSNRERSRVLARLVMEKALPEMHDMADRAAVLRVRKVLADPSPELMTIRDAAADAFHRLYRQRNLILHGGQLDSVTLAASLRTVSKLAGAGMDRITHAQYVQSIRPLELVASSLSGLSLPGEAISRFGMDSRVLAGIGSFGHEGAMLLFYLLTVDAIRPCASNSTRGKPASIRSEHSPDRAAETGGSPSPI